MENRFFKAGKWKMPVFKAGKWKQYPHLSPLIILPETTYARKASANKISIGVVAF